MAFRPLSHFSLAALCPASVLTFTSLSPHHAHTHKHTHLHSFSPLPRLRCILAPVASQMALEDTSYPLALSIAPPIRACANPIFPNLPHTQTALSLPQTQVRLHIHIHCSDLLLTLSSLVLVLVLAVSTFWPCFCRYHSRYCPAPAHPSLSNLYHTASLLHLVPPFMQPFALVLTPSPGPYPLPVGFLVATDSPCIFSNIGNNRAKLLSLIFIA